MSTLNESSSSGGQVSRLRGYTVLVVTWLLGSASLAAFFGFHVFLGPVHLIDFQLGTPAALLLDALLCFIFFVQHSVMVRESFRHWTARILPPIYDGAAYSIASSIALLMLVVFWQESGHPLVVVDGVLRWVLRGVFLLSVAGFAWGILALGSFDTFGLKPILSELRGTQAPILPFTIRGPYRWVRHPLYFFCLLMIWSHPDLTTDRLLFNLFFTVWIVVGTVLEERDLVGVFGDRYREYQHRVPMLVPVTLRPLQH